MIPKHLDGERIVLRFGSVTHHATVYLDGKEIVTHSGGFLPFEVNITEIATIGSHRLTVKVNNVLTHSTLPVGNYSEHVAEDGTVTPVNEPNFDFFNYAGIHRPVKYIQLHIVMLKISLLIRRLKRVEKVSSIIK